MSSGTKNPPQSKTDSSVKPETKKPNRKTLPKTHRQMTNLEKIVGPLVYSGTMARRFVYHGGKAAFYKEVAETSETNKHGPAALIRKLGRHRGFENLLDLHNSTGGRMVVCFPNAVELKMVQDLRKAGHQIHCYRDKQRGHDKTKNLPVHNQELQDGDIYLINDCPEFNPDVLPQECIVLYCAQVITGKTGSYVVRLPPYGKDGNEVPSLDVGVNAWHTDEDGLRAVVYSDSEVLSYCEVPTDLNLFKGGVQKYGSRQVSVYPVFHYYNRTILVLEFTDRPVVEGYSPLCGRVTNNTGTPVTLVESCRWVVGRALSSPGVVASTDGAIATQVDSLLRSKPLLLRFQIKDYLISHVKAGLASTDISFGAKIQTTWQDIATEVKLHQLIKEGVPQVVAPIILDFDQKMGLVAMASKILKYICKFGAYLKAKFGLLGSKMFPADLVSQLRILIVSHPSIRPKVKKFRRYVLGGLGRLGFVKKIVASDVTHQIYKIVSLLLTSVCTALKVFGEEAIKDLSLPARLVFVLVEGAIALSNWGLNNDVNGAIPDLVGVGFNAAFHMITMFVPFPLRVMVHWMYNLVSTYDSYWLEDYVDMLNFEMTERLLPEPVIERLTDEEMGFEYIFPPSETPMIPFLMGLGVTVDNFEVDSSRAELHALVEEDTIDRVRKQNLMKLVKTPLEPRRPDGGMKNFLYAYKVRVQGGSPPVRKGWWNHAFSLMTAERKIHPGKIPTEQEIEEHIVNHYTGYKKITYLESFHQQVDRPEETKDKSKITPKVKKDEVLVLKPVIDGSRVMKPRFFYSMLSDETVLSMSLFLNLGKEMEIWMSKRMYFTPGYGLTRDSKSGESIPVLYYAPKSNDAKKLVAFLGRAINMKCIFIVNSTDDTTLGICTGSSFHAIGLDIKGCDISCGSDSQGMFSKFLKIKYPNSEKKLARIKTQSAGIRTAGFDVGGKKVKFEWYGNHTSSGEFTTAEKGKLIVYTGCFLVFERFGKTGMTTMNIDTKGFRSSLLKCFVSSFKGLGLRQIPQEYNSCTWLRDVFPPYLSCNFTLENRQIFITPLSHFKTLQVKSNTENTFTGTTPSATVLSYLRARSFDPGLMTTGEGRALKRMFIRIGGAPSPLDSLKYQSAQKGYVSMQDTLPMDQLSELGEVIRLNDLKYRLGGSPQFILSYYEWMEKIDAVMRLEDLPLDGNNEYFMKCAGDKFGVDITLLDL